MWQGQTEMDDLSIVICRLAGYQTCFVLRTPATHVIGLDSPWILSTYVPTSTEYS